MVDKKSKKLMTEMRMMLVGGQQVMRIQIQVNLTRIMLTLLRMMIMQRSINMVVMRMINILGLEWVLMMKVMTLTRISHLLLH